MPLRGDAAPGLVFLPDLPGAGGTGTIDGDERHYVVNVCRAASGSRLSATDGEGRRASVRITSIGRRATFEVESVDPVVPAPMATIACGAPEGTRGDWLIEKLAELGIGRFQPLETERGRWRWSPSRAGRFDRIAIAALKQSQQFHRLRIAAAQPLKAWIESSGVCDVRWLADRDGAPPLSAGLPGRVFVGVSGPAAGWTGSERSSLLAAGFEPVRIGTSVLRAETAGVAIAAIWAGVSPAGSGTPVR